jgi:hypothetical protein
VLGADDDEVSVDDAGSQRCAHGFTVAAAGTRRQPRGAARTCPHYPVAPRRRQAPGLSPVQRTNAR